MKRRRVPGAALCAAAFFSHIAFAAGPDAPSPLSARELVEIRDLSGVAVSPNGAHAAVQMSSPDIGSNQVHLAWYVVPLAGHGEARKIADGGDPNLGENGVMESQTPIWSGDSQWIYYRALQKQEMQVWRTRWDGSRTEQLTHDAADVKAIVLDAGKDRLFYLIGADRTEILAAEQNQYDNGVLNDGSLVPGFPIARSYPLFGRLSMYRLYRNFRSSPGFVHAGLLADRPDHLMMLSLTPGAAQPAVARPATDAETADYETLMQRRLPSPEGGWERLASPDGRRFATVHDASGAEQLSWATADEPAALVSCLDSACRGRFGSLKLIAWLDAATLVFTNSDLTGQSLYLWAVKAKKVRRFAFTPGVFAAEGYGNSVCPMAHDEIVCVTSAASSPPRLEAISLHGGRARTLFDPNPNMTAQRLGTSERLIVKNEYGDELAAFLILPHDYRPGTRLPLVITSYTCNGFLRGGSGEDVSEHLLAAAGIAAVCLNDDVSSTRVPRPGDRWANGESSSLAFRKAVVELLERRGLIDAQRVAISGLSYSATLTLYTISRVNLFAAAEITSQGYEDPISIYMFGNARHSAFLEPDYYRDISPALNADKIHTPLLMLLSDTEYLQMTQLYSNLRDLHRPAEMVIYPDEYHIKRQPRHRLAVYDKSIAWQRFWLQGYEGPAAEQRSQYERWETLCDAQSALDPARTVYCARSNAPGSAQHGQIP